MTSKELWHPDIKIDIDIVKAAIESQFKSLAPLTAISKIDEGWDNAVFMVNDCYIFRFPRRQLGVDLIDRENALLPNIIDRFDIAFPNPVFIGKPEQNYPHPFQGYKKLIGQTSSESPLTYQDRVDNIVAIAKFLKNLHAIKSEEAKTLGARPPFFDRTQKDRMFADLQGRISRLKQLNVCAFDDQKINDLFDLAESADLKQSEHCLIHGDLYFRHLLFQDKKLSAVIDWGDACINHPAVDLSVVHSFFPQSSHTLFLEHYGDVSKDTWHYARFLGMYSALTIMLYAFDRDEKALLEEAKVCFKMIML